MSRMRLVSMVRGVYRMVRHRAKGLLALRRPDARLRLAAAHLLRIAVAERYRRPGPQHMDSLVERAGGPSHRAVVERADLLPAGRRLCPVRDAARHRAADHAAAVDGRHPGHRL